MNTLLSSQGFQQYKIEIIIFAIALLIRLIFIGSAGLENHLYDGLWDQQIYWDIGTNLASGDGFSLSEPRFNADAGLTSIEPPAYPVAIAISITLFGDSYLPMRLLNVVMSALTAVLAYKLGVQLFSARVGILAGLMLALHPTLISYTRSLMPESLFIFFLTLAVLLSFRYIERLTLLNSLLMSLAWSIVFLLRADGAIYAIAIAIYALYTFWRNDRQRIVSSIIYLIPGIAIFLLLWGPWVVHNYALHGAFIPSTTLSGINMWERNYYSYYRTNDPDRYPSDILPELVDVPDWGDLNELERDHALSDLGSSFIREHPLEFVKYGVSRMVIAYPLIPRSQEFAAPEPAASPDDVTLDAMAVRDDPQYNTLVGRITVWAFRIVFVTAVLGIVFALMRNRRELLAFVLIILFNLMIAFSISGRERGRLLIEPFIVLCSANFLITAWDWFARRFQRRRSRSMFGQQQQVP